jgi:hypothetical protein
MLLAAALAIASLALPAAASAAVARPTLYDVRSITESDGSQELLVAGEVPAGTSLPVQISLAIPKGAQIDWCGQILGGDSSKDQPLPYRTKSGPAYDTVTFTLTKARRGQVEVSYDAGVVRAGDLTKSAVTYIPAAAAGKAYVAVAVPSNASVTYSTGGAVRQTDGAGTAFYTKTFLAVAAGQKLQVRVEYTAAAAGTAGNHGKPAGQSGFAPGPLFWVAVAAGVVVLVAIGLALRVAAVARRRARRRAQREHTQREPRREPPREPSRERSREPRPEPLPVAGDDSGSLRVPERRESTAHDPREWLDDDVEFF